MRELTLTHPAAGPGHILCLGAHCDDIEIGCGGTLLKLLATGRWQVTWAVFSASGRREQELQVSARRFLRRARGTRLVTHALRDGYFPGQYIELKDRFESLKGLPAPDVIFTHEREDLHQDHRLVSELTWNTFRDHLVLEYEVPKYDGGLTTPNAYVPLTRAQVAAKSRALLSCYASQQAKPWFTTETFEALARLRGVEAGAGSGWAEGFHMRKCRLA